MISRIFVLALVAGLCLVAAAPRNLVIEAPEYMGPQMVTPVPLPRATSPYGTLTTSGPLVCEPGPCPAFGNITINR